MDILLYSIFLSAFLIASFSSYYQDFHTNQKYIQEIISKKDLWKIYKKCLPLVSFNIFVVIPLLLCLPINKILQPFNYYHISHIPISLFLVDFSFYFCHYLFHNKFLYKFHKVHHQIKRPICISALYLHPIDLIFGNILPLFLPIFVLQSSYEILCIWIFLTVFETVFGAHSGIDGRGNAHDKHHKYFIVNYGSGFYICDKLLKTYL